MGFYHSRLLTIFEQASGMVLNWDKSFILWLGSWQTLPPQLPPADQVQVVPPGDKLRVLGLKLGHYQDKHEAWHALGSSIKQTLNLLNKVPDDQGNTLTANSIVIGKTVFIVSHLFTPHVHVKELDTWMKKFIRGSSYIVSDTKRYASKADGNLVPLQSLDHLTTTLTAKSCYSFLVNGHLKKYAKAWLWELSALATDSGFECVDHLLMAAALPNPNLTQTQKPYQLFTHASVVAFTTMGMVRPITLAWEDIAYQPIFGNRNILNPNAIGGPCAWTKDMVCMQDAGHFKYVLVEPSIGTHPLSPHHPSLT